MTDRNHDEPLFSALLTPHRSLSRSGFTALMLAIGSSSLVAGAIFWMAGAWPLAGFMGLDVLAAYLAFRWSYSTAKAFEQIEMTRDALVVRKVDARGNSREFRFHPYWARLEIERTEPSGVAGIRLSSHGRRVALGRFLAPEDRESLAKALGHALRLARSAPDEGVQETGGRAA